MLPWFFLPTLLFRNLDPSNGLCNGTRFVCQSFSKNIIYVEIIVSDRSCRKTSFSSTNTIKPTKMTMDIHSSSRENNSPFIYALQWQLTKHKDKQFLIMLKYIFLKNVFSHGQLYVAPSRKISMNTTKVWKTHRWQ